MLRSHSIENQIRNIMKSLDCREELRRFVMVQAINTLCNLKFTYNDLCFFTNISKEWLEGCTVDSDVQEVLDYQEHQFKIHSPIYARYLMRQEKTREQMIDMLADIYEACAKNDQAEKRYGRQRKDMVSRSNIILLLTENGQLTRKNEMTIYNYFEKIKNLPSATDNPFFWLQFGITALNLEEYDLASSYFDNAYAQAKLIRQFDTYQIDTHYARLLLCREMSVNTNIPQQALDTFIKANQLLLENSNIRLNLSYVLRQAGLYRKYYLTYHNIFSRTEQEEFLELAIKMSKQFESYFKLPELDRIPAEVLSSYEEYRRLFADTPYRLELSNCEIYYKSARGKDFKNRI